MKRTAARDGRRPEEGCAVRRQSNFLSEPLLPYPPAGARLKSALARTTDCLKSNRPFTGALTMRSSRWEVSCREPAVEDGCRNPAVLPPPSRDHTLRDLLRLRQRGKISLHGPPGVQQRLRIGAVGDPGEVALTLSSSRPETTTGRARLDPASPGIPRRGCREPRRILPGAWGIVALARDDDRGSLSCESYRPVCQRRSWCRRQTTVTPRSPSGPPSGIPGGDDCGYSCILPLFCRLPA